MDKVDEWRTFTRSYNIMVLRAILSVTRRNTGSSGKDLGVVVQCQRIRALEMLGSAMGNTTGPNTNKRFTKMLEIVKPVTSTRKKGRGILN